MHQSRPQPARLQRIENITKAAFLLQRRPKVFLVRSREVRQQPLELQPIGVRQAVCERRRPLRTDAHPAHAGIHLQMQAGGLPRILGSCGGLMQLPGLPHSQRDALGYQFRKPRRRRESQQQNRAMQPGPAQLKRFFSLRHSTPRCAGSQRGLRHRHRPVPVRVCLDHCHHPRGGVPGEKAHVTFNGTEVNFRPV